MWPTPVPFETNSLEASATSGCLLLSLNIFRLTHEGVQKWFLINTLCSGYNNAINIFMNKCVFYVQLNKHLSYRSFYFYIHATFLLWNVLSLLVLVVSIKKNTPGLTHLLANADLKTLLYQVIMFTCHWGIFGNIVSHSYFQWPPF